MEKLCTEILMTLLLLVSGFGVGVGQNPFPGAADQEEVFLRSVCRLYGLSSVEEIGEERLQALQQLLEHPLRINEVSFQVLQQSVLFSAYQAASLWAYISSTGALLSPLELGMVDGFNPEKASLYAPFLDFSCSSLREHSIWSSHQVHWRTATTVGFSDWKTSLKESFRTALRYSGDIGTAWSVRVGGAWPPSTSRSWPADATAHLCWRSRRVSLMVGDMNLRFGQGLALWSGLSFASLPTSGLLMKNPRGICTPDSYTGGSAMPGVGADIQCGKCLFSGALVLPQLRAGKTELLPAFSFSWFGRRVRIGHTLTGVYDFRGKECSRLVSSVDITACLKGTDLFAELASDWLSLHPAVIGGFNVPIGEKVRLAATGRYYPMGYQAVSAAAYSSGRCENEAGTTLVLDACSENRSHQLTFSADAAFHPHSWKTITAGDWQLRTALLYLFHLQEIWTFSSKYSFRWRDNYLGATSRYTGQTPRHEWRNDLRYTTSFWEVGGRIHLQYSESFSFLTYVEGAWKTDKVRLYLRQGFFVADHWADRIYAYERDFPSSFSVPARCGRGCWTALYLTAEVTAWCRLALKTDYNAWPWTPDGEKKKPGKAGLKFYCAFRF